MSTFSWVYKQYTFSDPIPPPLQVYRIRFLDSTIWVSCKITFIVQQQIFTLISSLLDMWQVIGLAKYYDMEIWVNIVYIQI